MCSATLYDLSCFVLDSVCGMTCLGGQKSFYIKTGTDKSKGPTICYDGKM